MFRPLTVSTALVLACAPDGAQPADLSLDADGLEIASADGRFSFALGGRLHLDWTGHSGGAGSAPPNSTDTRRARVLMEGSLGSAWDYSAEVDFAGGDRTIKDLSLAYDVREGLRLTIGQQKQPYSLAVEMSSNDLPFVERSIDTALIIPVVDRAVGLRMDAFGRRWFAAAAVHGEPIDDDGEGWGTSGRFVFAPLREQERVLHLGVRAAYREPDGTSGMRLRAETTPYSNVAMVDTADIGPIEHVTLYGPEAAYAIGPFSIAGEYNRAQMAHARGDLSFNSWHVAATWSLTGETRAAAYDLEAGEFKRLEPARSLAPGHGAGAWELAARYAAIDLNDELVGGGEAETIGLATNWYPNHNVRVMLDWTHVLRARGLAAMRDGTDGVDIFTLRAQCAF